MADIKPTSFPDFFTRTPQCQSFCHPGGFKALPGNAINTHYKDSLQGTWEQYNAPKKKICGVVETEHIVIILDVVLVQQLVQLLQLEWHKATFIRHNWNLLTTNQYYYLRVFKLQRIPHKICRKRIRLWAYLWEWLVRLNGFIDWNHLICYMKMQYKAIFRHQYLLVKL